jgi:hypothetical protein
MITEIDFDGLMVQVRRYLEAVDVFRTQGHEPHWRPERPESERRGMPRRLVLGTPPVR